jgi:hypothetical protein
MSESPYELQRLVTIGTFSTPWEAQVAQARLAAEGLSALIADEHVIRMVALSHAIGGIQLKVREQDAAAAGEVLRRLAPLPEIYLLAQEPPDAASPDATSPDAAISSRAAGAAGAAGATTTAALADRQCPACGSADLQLERSSRRVLGLLPVTRKGYRCGDCGVLWRTEEVIGGTRRGDPASAHRSGPSAVDPGRDPGSGFDPNDPDGDIPLITVARFHTPWEAHLARTLLESEGVRCCVLEERLPTVNLLSADLVAFNRLEVCQPDAARAAAILARAWRYPPLAAVPDDSDDAP